jgi:hypothetical protein
MAEVIVASSSYSTVNRGHLLVDGRGCKEIRKEADV